MPANESKKPAIPPAAHRRGTTLNLEPEDKRSAAGNVVHRTDGRRVDRETRRVLDATYGTTEMLPFKPRVRAIGEASLTERAALVNAVRPIPVMQLDSQQVSRWHYPS